MPEPRLFILPISCFELLVLSCYSGGFGVSRFVLAVFVVVDLLSWCALSL